MGILLPVESVNLAFVHWCPESTIHGDLVENPFQQHGHT